MVKLLFATSNEGKIREVRNLFIPLADKITFLSYADLADTVCDIEEPYETFRENASVKSFEITKEIGISSFADDSGLCVDALNGAPGVYSARYASRIQGIEIESDVRTEANNRQLLSDLEDIENRRAYYVSVISVTFNLFDFKALVGSERLSQLPEIDTYPPDFGKFYRRDDYVLAVVEGRCFGNITREPRGEGGFGYDPLFEMDEFGKTAAELTLEEKNRVSHRRRAVDAFVELLKGVSAPMSR